MSQRRPDPFLVVLLLLTACSGVVWTLVIPPFQQPDEPDHFVYVDNIARDWDLFVDGRYSQATWHAVVTSKASAVAHHERSIGEAGSEAADDVREIVRSKSRSQVREGAGSLHGDVGVEVEYSRAVGYPPAYYATAAAAVSLRHVVGDDNDVFGDLYLARLVSVAMGVVTVLFAWLAFGHAFPSGSHVARRVATGVVALLPMPAYLRTGVNADVLVTMLVAIAFWLGVRAIRSERSLSIQASVLAGLVLGVGLLTKQTFAVVLIGWVGLLIVEALRRRLSVGGALLRGMVTGVVVAVGAGWFFATSSSVGVTNNVASGDVNLLGPIEYFRQISNDRWRPQINEWWGVYGWLDTGVAASWYRVLKTITLWTGLVGAALIVAASVRRRLDPVTLVALGWVVLWTSALTYVEYSLMRTGKSGPFVQGRYYMPMLVPLVFLGAESWRVLGGYLPRRIGVIALGVLPLVAGYHLATIVQFLIPRYYL